MTEQSTSRRQTGGAADPERRRLLRLFGAAPLLVCGAWALAACDRGEESRNPYANETSPRGAPSPGSGSQAPESGAKAAEGSGSEPAPAGAGDQPGGDQRLVTEVPAMQATVAALQYTNQSTKPDQRCAGCQMYTSLTETRGRCQLFSQGRVASQGWCTSWVAKAKT